MKQYIPNWLKTKMKALRPGHAPPPPSFMRVSYCVPRQVVLLTARHNGAENVWPIDWHVPLSIAPQLYGISLNPGYGASLIRDSGAFVVNFVPASWEEIVFFCGRTSGRDVDKFEAAQLRRVEGQVVNAPCLAEALGYLECEVQQSLTVGDHLFFVGQVRHATYQPEAARLHHLEGSLAHLAESFETKP
jgi:flavin reductase (DIM6/NTAB) family NADH-FMN oxidoreductase RutF